MRYSYDLNYPAYYLGDKIKRENNDKIVTLMASIANFGISLIIYLLFDFSSNQFQFVQEHINVNIYEIYLGVDGISIYFILLTTTIMPLALISN